LSQDELAAWERTPRNAALATKRTELQRAAPDYPPIAALIEVVKFSKLAEDFGPTLAARVSSVTGRIHASYGVAGTNTGRATCRHPNLQQIPRTSGRADFRALFVPEPGHVLIVADYSSMELRAAAAISGDRTMTEAFRRGDDLHTITAARVSGKRPEEVTKAERQAAKATNFGSIYGIGPTKLMLSAWGGYGVNLSIEEARAQLRAFEPPTPVSCAGVTTITSGASTADVLSSAATRRAELGVSFRNPASDRAGRSIRPPQTCRFKASAATSPCWRSPMSTNGSSEPVSMAVRSRGFTTRSSWKSQSRTPITPP
jgi:DNA polymerase family A